MPASSEGTHLPSVRLCILIDARVWILQYKSDVVVADELILLAVLLPLSGAWPAGQTVAGAVELAVERVNADATLLPGRTLGYQWRDSACSAPAALNGLGSLISSKDARPSAVIGPACRSKPPKSLL